MQISFGCTLIFYSRSFSNTARRAARCAWKPLVWTMVSSMNARVTARSYLRTLSISCWNSAGAFLGPKGVRRGM
jgi:hypothetical protein